MLTLTSKQKLLKEEKLNLLIETCNHYYQIGCRQGESPTEKHWQSIHKHYHSLSPRRCRL